MPLHYTEASMCLLSGMMLGITLSALFGWSGRKSERSDPSHGVKKHKAFKGKANKGEFEHGQPELGQPGCRIKEPQRTVTVSDALVWMEAQPSFPTDSCVITGIPDLVEAAPETGAGTHIMNVAEYDIWVQRTATMIFEKIRLGSFAIFVVTDVKIKGPDTGTYCKWMDKSFLLQSAAHCMKDVHLLWHKIAAFDDIGVLGPLGRARYSHILCFGKGPTSERHDGPVASIPDVSRRGYVTWARGMGVRCGLALCKYAKKRGVKVIVDPFCGEGSVLALAGYCGLDSIGVELSRKRANVARNLDGFDLVAKDRACCK